MEINRRNFLKIGGITVLGLAAKPAIDALMKVNPAGAATTEGVPSDTRWAMAIDLKACTSRDGCTACIDACHSIHNVPDFGNPKDEVKWLWTVPYEEAFEEQEHEFTSEDIKNKPTLVLCNHCDNPPCARVCPTKATWKREDGIVMMDYHRCIGCRFCMAACPFGSRSFNWRDPRPFIKEIDPNFPTRTRGVVEKCNFCAERLAKGLIPACVEACPEKALVFGNLEETDSEVRDVLRQKFSIRRKPELGTHPEVYYIV
jgi:Fe-S-cluster-containing dehydrogenase component